jgi:hypothetical protein
MRFIRQFLVETVYVGFRIYGSRADTQLVEAANDAQGNFTPVGNQHLGK